MQKPRKTRGKFFLAKNSKVPHVCIQIVDRTKESKRRSKCFTVYVPYVDAIKAVLQMVDKKGFGLIPPGEPRRK